MVRYAYIQAKTNVMWQETGLFIGQNVFLCHGTILLISQKIRRSHGLDNHWSLTEYSSTPCSNNLRKTCITV
jgi:uncharacterized membrane protein